MGIRESLMELGCTEIFVASSGNVYCKAPANLERRLVDRVINLYPGHRPGRQEMFDRLTRRKKTTTS